LTPTFAARVRSGDQVLGTFIKLAGLESVDLVARSGLDFAVVDFEHSQLDARQAGAMVRHAAAIGLPTLVRVPAIDSGQINRFLEAGAAGIQLSTLRTCRQADALAAAMRYPPDGTRSVSTAQPAAGYGHVPLAQYLADSEANPPLVVGQIETARTEDPLDEIVPHLDVAFLGTTDLSVDLGAPGNLEHPAVIERVAQVAAAANHAGVRLGGFAPGPAALNFLRSEGATYVVVGSDMQALQKGLATFAAAGNPAEQEAR
jgi:4-hydroxy-2-oxoheptanedioate aldolase